MDHSAGIRADETAIVGRTWMLPDGVDIQSQFAVP